jgi:hypothetical protein
MILGLASQFISSSMTIPESLPSIMETPAPKSNGKLMGQYPPHNYVTTPYT